MKRGLIIALFSIVGISYINPKPWTKFTFSRVYKGMKVEIYDGDCLVKTKLIKIKKSELKDSFKIKHKFNNIVIIVENDTLRSNTKDRLIYVYKGVNGDNEIHSNNMSGHW